MKSICLFITILFAHIPLFGQTKANILPLIIKGQFTNCSEKSLYLLFSDKQGLPLTDTFHIDESGSFYLKTYKIKEPQRAEIQGNNVGIKNLLVAPGYDLNITGNAKDGQTLSKTKKISGVGSQSNQYYLILDSIQRVRASSVHWLDLKENELLAYARKTKKLKDSIANVIFDKVNTQDKFHRKIGSIVRLDNTFYELYMLTTHVYWNRYNYEKSVSLIKNNIENKILNSIYKDQYLVSNDYRNWVITGGWLDYLMHLDYKKDSTLQKVKNYKLKKVDEIYKGSVKDFTLFRLIKYELGFADSFEELNNYKEIFELYVSKIKNDRFKSALYTQFTEKVTDLIQLQKGKPAPPFTLVSNSGIAYSLEDFSGKVLYIDLWASWCVPCREETPSFKALYEKYKSDKRIAFVSIAVNDEIKKWQKALNEDKPEWIQLLDKDGIVSKAYVANEIPKFILIDKTGKIVSLDAPRPSSGREIESLLDKEIEK